MAPWDFDDRTRAILCAVVDNYIETAEPVGSRTLSKALDLGLSPATIRNIMADLTETGFLDQPHTSAGRLPTDRAYRFYVDACRVDMDLADGMKQAIEAALERSTCGLDQLLANTTKVLAGMTHFTGVVSSPPTDAARLRLIEFIRVSSQRVYVVLITASNMVYHKLLEVTEDLPQAFLDRVSRTLNEQFAHQSLSDVRQRVLKSLVEDKEHFDQLLAQGVRLSKKAFDITDERELYIEGQVNIVKEFHDLVHVQRLLKALEEKMTIIDLLDRMRGHAGVNITIGAENGLEELYACSVVTATYGGGGTPMGVIGVIGPTRMNYNRVIPIIDYTARMLSEVISHQ